MRRPRLCHGLSLFDFISTNGPTGEAVTPDGPVEAFYHSLGLNHTTYMHQMVFEKMMEEARAGAKRLNTDRDALIEEFAHDMSLQPPFRAEQIAEVAFKKQMTRIHETASEMTMGLYDIVQNNDENWALRWVLWRALTARDGATLAPTNLAKPSVAEFVGSCRQNSLSASALDVRAIIPPLEGLEGLEGLERLEGLEGLEGPHVMQRQQEGTVHNPEPMTGNGSSHVSHFWRHVLNQA